MKATLRALLALVVIGVSLPAAGCESDLASSEGEAPIGEATFIEAYVALRLEAREWEGGHIPEEERARVLAERGTTEEELRTFIQVHGRNVPRMNRIWEEVRDRVQETLEAERAEPEPVERAGPEPVERAGPEPVEGE